MKQDEYVETIVYNGQMMNIGIDDCGQTYFIEYAEDGQLKEDCVGSYITDYVDYIEYRFGDPELNCPIYKEVITTDTECCEEQTRGFCSRCRKHLNNVDYVEQQKRKEDFEKWLKTAKTEN